MTTSAQYWQVIREGEAARAMTPRPALPERPPFDIAPNDPIIAYFQSTPGAVDVQSLELESPALAAMRAAGVRLVVPLVSQGELIGLLNLGPRLSEQEYSADDRKLLDDLASHAAPAVRVAQLVRQQEAEIRSRERLEHELQVAHLIQRNFLPKVLPKLAGWKVAAQYRPARAVGGDFYDFIDLPDGKLGLVIGDVTDKGVPAALVMAATRSVLRAAATRLVAPSQVLERVNESMVNDIAENMFITCLYAVLDPATGVLRYANAGHNPPYVRTARGVIALRARGMPIGLMRDMRYEEKEAVLEPGQTMLLHSDGLIEAHGTRREMFGNPRLARLVGADGDCEHLIDRCLADLTVFTGPSWEQEDDITLVMLARDSGGTPRSNGHRLITEFTVPSEPGRERGVMERVGAEAERLGLRSPSLERLKTAVAETAMNAIEHGNRFQAELLVGVRVLASDDELIVEISDEAGDRTIPEAQTPDIEAKLQGLQKARGWGLFLIKNMVDDVRVISDGKHNKVELVVRLKGD